MTTTRRQRQRTATITEIKYYAHQLMAQHGAASLSLRAIAREMGLTSPALYRYFSSRDDLVTALIMDAFTSLAQSQEASFEKHQTDTFFKRLLEQGLNYRAWALENPELYSLIFGTPIPHYHAPEELTGPKAQHALMPLVRLLIEAHEAGKIRYPDTYKQISPRFKNHLEASYEKMGRNGPPEVIMLALTTWGHIHGLVSMELYNQLQQFVTDTETLIHLDLITWLNKIGINE